MGKIFQAPGSSIPQYLTPCGNHDGPLAVEFSSGKGILNSSQHTLRQAFEVRSGRFLINILTKLYSTIIILPTEEETLHLLYTKSNDFRNIKYVYASISKLQSLMEIEDIHKQIQMRYLISEEKSHEIYNTWGRLKEQNRLLKNKNTYD